MSVLRLTRREVLLASSMSGLSLLTGCQGDYAPGRELFIQDIESTQTESRWSFSITVTSNDNTEHGGFSNVRLVGYSEEGDAVCEERVGDMTDGSMTVRKSVTLECDSFPHVIAPEAESSPCTESTYIDVRIYDGAADTWTSHEWECGESIPELVERQ